MKQPERIEAFLEGFLVPLLAGDRVLVVSPVTVADVQAMALADFVRSESALRAFELIRREASHHGVDLAARRFSPFVLASAAALANLAFSTDPELDPKWQTEARVRLINETRALLALSATPEERLDAIVLHLLVTRFAAMPRVETDYHYWAGKQRFVGRAVPARLMVMKTLRRVQTIESHVPVLRALMIDVADLWDALVARSPITVASAPDVAKSVHVDVAFAQVIADRALARFARVALERLPRSARYVRLGLLLDASYASALPDSARTLIIDFVRDCLLLELAGDRTLLDGPTASYIEPLRALVRSHLAATPLEGTP